MARDLLAYVQAFERLRREGVAADGASLPTLPEPAADAPVALLLSPHPDDEALTGGLPLRLRLEAGWRVVNLPVTLGSAIDQRARRWRELQACCQVLGFELLEPVHRLAGRLEPALQQRDPDHWAACVQTVVDAMRRWRPRLVCFPHALDVQPAHVGTHLLAAAALLALGDQRCALTVQTEYWGTLPEPNLMVQLTAEQLAHLARATACHAGEVARNPYHLNLPAQGIDAVRRGAELVGGLGQAAPDIAFLMLYRVQRWNGRTEASPWPGGRLLGSADDVAALFA